MNKWLKVAWHDPVGSKVIASVIIGVPGVLGLLWSRSDFSTNGVQVWAGVKSGVVAAYSWLAGPLSMPRASFYVIMIMLLVFFVLVIKGQVASGREIADRVQQEDALRAVARAGINQAIQPLSQTRIDSGPVAPALNQSPLRNAMAQMTTPPPDLSEDHRALLASLFRIYPTGIPILNLATIFEVSYPVLEKMCEDLAKQKLVNVVEAAMTNPAKVYLAKPGRDYCIENGLDTSE
jgi:hypothetical protein